MTENAIAESARLGRVAVLMGGDSAEREISLLGGNAVLKGLQEAGVDAVGIDAGPDFLQQLTAHKADRVFIMLHGRKGEDGKVQAALELTGIPYTGSGVLACALAMDKIRCKKVWLADGLSTPAFVELDADSDWHEVIARLGTAFVKPVREGSSIGISRAATAQEMKQAYEKAKQFDSLVIAEQWIEGREFTVTILGDQVLPVIELQTGNEFYDFEAKYESHETRYLCPPEMSAEKTAELETMALCAYRTIGCSGWGRVDVMQDKNGKFWLLEVNTIPGMTEHSLVPMAARAHGLSFISLLTRILESSFVDRRENGN
ncbi:MAG: D-alanine--D-alanine ligase [Pseudohongiellaceae bacterium]